MNGFILACLFFVAAVSAQDPNARTAGLSFICPNGFERDRFGRLETCGGFVGEQCPPTSRCSYLPRSDYGYCCRRRSSQLQCDVGEPLDRYSCGINRPCPFIGGRRYECVTDPINPFTGGICCPRSRPNQLQCTVGYPVPGATCGGYLNSPCPDPRRHECVRDEFNPHSEGICCSRSGGIPTRY